MAFQIDPRIPLQALANPINIGDSFAKAQENQLRLQALRDEYNAAKEERDRQKAMRSGIQTDIEQIQRGIPAQYSPLQYQQTPQTGQMPYGMTGVLANERGQNMPQPKAFGEDILAGNFNLNREMVAPAIEGREPTYLEQLQIAARQALKAGDIDSAFKFSQAMQQQRIAEREQNAPVGNPYPVYDTSGNFVGTRIMTKSGQEMPFGQQGTTIVKPDVLSAKDKSEREFQGRKFRAEQEKAAKEIALKEREISLKANQPDPVSKALEIKKGEMALQKEAEAKEKFANATDGISLLDNYINALKESPQTGASETIQKGLGFIGMGSDKRLAAMAKAKQAGEALLTYAQKQPGPSTDKDVASYRAQMGVVLDNTLPAKARAAAAEQAKALLLKIQQKYGNYAESGKTSKQDDYMEYKKERDKAYKSGNYDLVRKLDAMAKQDGLTK